MKQLQTPEQIRTHVRILYETSEKRPSKLLSETTAYWEKKLKIKTWSKRKTCKSYKV